ncbi:MAG: UvrD-helicase domain-containing protein [bacterium]
MNLLEGLNDRQKEAVITTEGPVMVIAGAGSGKTKVLTHRIAYIINELGISSHNILAVTFTNKAALEMKSRVSKLVNIDTKNMWISTFHSFCARVLRREIQHLGYRKDFTIIDTDESLKEIKIVMKKYDFTDYEPRDIQCFISNYKNDMKVLIPDRNIGAFYDFYDKYESHLFENNLLDFDDLILKTLKLLNGNLSILEKYSNMFNYVMIDEFQDTNKSQYELVLLLSSAHNNIFIVGDQDQSIYSFRGALVTNIAGFKRDYKETKTILLEQNYRSTQNILDAANKIISSNRNRIEKKLFTDNKDGIDPIIKCLDTSYGEANYLTNEINNLLRQGYQYKDIAVIYRLNSLSRGFEDEFIKKNIPYVIYGGLSYFSRKEVKDIIAYLRLICNFDDNFSLRRIINVPKRKVGDASMRLLEDSALLHQESLFSVLDKTSLSSAVSSNLRDLKNTIVNLRSKIEEMELSDFVKEVIDKTKYKDMLKDADEEDRLDNVMELRSVLLDVSEFYEGTNQEKLEAFLLDVALKTDTDNVKDDDNKIKLMNYHQAKGLEFKVVFMTAMEANIFPAQRSITEFEIEEEYRICYVGITRAMEKLYLTHCESRRLYGKDSFMQKSIFLRKLQPKSSSTQPKSQPYMQKHSYYNDTVYSEISYNIGDKVQHKAWGIGVVVKVDADNVSIAFDIAVGLKILKAGHPSYSRIEE